jgi:hypothetical protein
MAFPIADKDANRVVEEISFNYALDVKLNELSQISHTKSDNLISPWTWKLQNAPVMLTVPAMQFDWEPTDMQPLPKHPVSKGKKTKIQLVPYNLTKFRVSMFPLTRESWENRTKN